MEQHLAELAQTLEMLLARDKALKQEAIAREHGYLAENEEQRKEIAQRFGRDSHLLQMLNDSDKTRHSNIARLQQDSEEVAMVREFLRDLRAGTVTTERLQEFADTIALRNFGSLDLNSK